VPVYVTFDPYVPSLEVRCLHQGHYQLEPPDANGRFWLPPLGLWLGIWPGTYQQLTGYWLRWWDEAGQLLPWSCERAEQERQRAERLAAHLRDRGIDPNSL